MHTVIHFYGSPCGKLRLTHQSSTLPGNGGRSGRSSVEALVPISPLVLVVVAVVVGRFCRRRGDAVRSMSDSSGLAYGASPGCRGRVSVRRCPDGVRRRLCVFLFRRERVTEYTYTANRFHI